MNNFIEVHNKNIGSPELINLAHVEEIRPDGNGVCIYFAFNRAGCDEQDYIRAKESYDTIKQLIGGNDGES